MTFSSPGGPYDTRSIRVHRMTEAVGETISHHLMYELVMFANTKAYSGFAVDDLRKAPRIRVVFVSCFA